MTCFLDHTLFPSPESFSLVTHFLVFHFKNKPPWFNPASPFNLLNTTLLSSQPTFAFKYLISYQPFNPRPFTPNSSGQGRYAAAAAAAKSLQSCPPLCDPIDGSPPGSPVPGILQARTLEWVAISLSSAWKWKVKVKSLSRVRLFASPWTAAFQAPPSVGFSRQEYWSGLPLPSPQHLEPSQI